MIQGLRHMLGRYRSKYLSKRPVTRWPLWERAARAKRVCRRNNRYSFDLLNPVSFTEKIAWYKLFYEHPDLTRLYDKYLFKGYVEEKLGPGHTAPLYGMWTDVEGLARDWDTLPDSFCLKSNCSTLGNNVEFIHDKRNVNKRALFEKVRKWLDPMNTGHNTCNRAYHRVKPRILAEKLLVPHGSDQLHDYKILCFNGKPDHVMATADRFPLERNALSYSYYDLSWNKLPITTPEHSNVDVPKPRKLETMIEIARKLSPGFPFVRVDFYDAEDGIYVGEMTLYPSPDYDQRGWDLALGNKFVLPWTLFTEMLKVLRKVKRRLWRLFQRPICQWPEEKRIAKAMQLFRDQMRYTFDLEHPVLFTEKRVWYELFYNHPDLKRIYDKYLFKGYIEEKLGPGYTAPLYGMWTNMRDFKRDWDSLPEEFCLKSNCSSLGNNLKIVHRKSDVDKAALFREVRKWLDPMNTAINSCNRAYYGVTPRILAEKLLAGKDGQLYDYKVMCFNGKPDHFLGAADRFPLKEGNLSKAYYDLSWNKLPVTGRGCANRDVPRPAHLEQMIEIAKKLSQGFPHIRVDFYDAEDGLYVGEMTLYSTAIYEQRGWDLRLGLLFELPNTGAREQAG